jgi:hypothetical protein
MESTSGLKIMDNYVEKCSGHYYRFIYKDTKGELGYTIVNVEEQNNELAIAKFENTFPDLVWRRFEEVPCV